MFEYPKNPAIKEYTTSKDEKRYKFQIYLGVNSITGKSKRTTKRGFKTPASANAAYRVFTYFYTLQKIQQNPFDHILYPKRNLKSTGKNRSDNFFSTDELEKFTKYLLNNESELGLTKVAFFITMAYTGVRKGELLALTWSDVDLDNKLIEINRTLVMNESGKLDTQQPKWGSFRTISINSLVTKTLQKYKDNIPGDSDLVFPSQKGTWRNLGKPNTGYNQLLKMELINIK